MTLGIRCGSDVSIIDVNVKSLRTCDIFVEILGSCHTLKINKVAEEEGAKTLSSRQEVSTLKKCLEAQNSSLPSNGDMK